MRLFVAINLPAAVREGIWQAAGEFRTREFPVRWVGPDALHLTLKFLGEVGYERLGEIIDTVESAVRGARCFTLPISGFGAFPSLRRPRVVWVGCERVAALELLQHRVEQEMEAVGFPLEGRPFRPHITLGRARRNARAREFAGFADLVGRVSYTAEPLVESVDVMESELSRRGARYTVRHAAELTR